MPPENQILRDLNLDIGNKESDGDVEYFRVLLAPKFAMRRANGSFNNGAEFLDAVQKSPSRQTEILSVTTYGDTSAVVSCIVRFPVGPDAKQFHNLRLFIRS